MIFDDQIPQYNYDDENGSDEELSSFINNNINSKIQKQSFSKKAQDKQINVNENQSNQPGYYGKVMMPRQFQKAKRVLSKIVNDYFIQLKTEYQRTLSTIEKSQGNDKFKKNAVSMYLRKDKIKNILQSVGQFVGINRKYTSILDLKFNYLQQQSKKLNLQARKGSFCYLPELQKIVNINWKGKIDQIKIISQNKSFKLPDYATPVPFKDSIYFLDPAKFDRKQKCFITDAYSYKVTEKGQLIKLQKQPQKQRIKCALVRDQNYIYLLGGMIGIHKIITQSCQKFNPKNIQFSQLPFLNKKHRCPSACVLKNQLWVFSQTGIQRLDKNQTQWKYFDKPWQSNFYPFQFVVPYSEKQILIFGGQKQENNSTQLKIYDIQYNWISSFANILPIPINSQKCWSPSFTDLGMAVISCIPGENKPDIKQKRNIVQITYLTTNGVFLHNMHTSK